MSDPVGLDATLARNSIARDIADVMFGTVDDGVILDALQWQGCLLAANRIMESNLLPGTVTTAYHDRLILQAQAEINTRGNRITELEAEVAALRLEVEARPFNGDASLRQQVVDRAVREALTKAARAVLEGADVAPGPDGKPTFIIPGPGPIVNPRALP